MDEDVIGRSTAELDATTRAIVMFEPNDALDVVEPQAQFERILQNHPRLRWDGGVAFFKMADILAAARNPAIVTNPVGFGGMGSRAPLIPLHVDGEVHRRYRKLLDPLLAPRRLAHLEAHVVQLASELIDGFIDDGQVEFHDAFAVPLPCTTFLRLFGLPLEDLAFLNGTKDVILKNFAPTFEEHARVAQEAGDRLRAYLSDALDEREREATPREDLIGLLTSAEVDGHRLSRDEILNIVHLFTIAGLDSVTASLTCIVGWLARHADERRRVVEDPTLLPAAIEELMRFENPVLTSGHRIAVSDTEVNGVPVKAGDQVSLCWSTGNLDPEVYPHPLTVDLERPVNPHITFAAGIHRCLGSHLARLELRAAIGELHRRIPDYEVEPGAVPEYHAMGGRAATYLPLVF